MKFLSSIFFLSLVFFSVDALAQNSIDVTFRYHANENAVRAFVPGGFNEWGSNESGRIAVDNVSLMQEDEKNGFWYKTISLTVGGGGSSNNGTSGYAYKFHEQYNSSGSDWNWFTDPLNPIAIGQNNDSFIEVTHPLIFQVQPSTGDILDETAEIWATVAALASDSIDVNASEIYMNGEAVATFEGHYEKERQLFFVKDITSLNPVVGENEMELIAITESGETTSYTVEFLYLPEVEPELVARPAGLEDGITYGESVTDPVRLSLFAPAKDYVFVIGDFNNWTPGENYLMKKDSLKADSVWHWIEIEGLSPGQEYAFQYLVEGEQRIADPYSALVLDPNNDQYISNQTFPDLKAYPEGKTTGYATLLQPGKEAYEWEITDFAKPAKEEMVIYELLLRDFLETSNFQTLTDSLDYLEHLGVNAIELMPVSEFDGNLSWGYNPSFHLALDKYYGTPEAFKRFVDEAHKRGMAVILDVVMNHATDANPFYQMYGNDDSYYFNSSARHSYSVFNDFDHSYSGTQYYTKRMIEHWVEEYKVDGFRWDLTKGFTQSCSANDGGCTNSYQQDRVDLLKKYADWQWAADSTFIVIFEHLGGENEEKEWANYRIDEGKGVMLWGNENHQYSEAAMGYSSNLTGVLSESRSSFERRHRVGYMESHDEQWLMFKNLMFGNSNDELDYDITKLGTALNRQKLAGAFFFTLPGPKMIWQFGELGYGYGENGEQCLREDPDCPSSAPGRTSAKPIRWDYYEDAGRYKLYQSWSALINLRNSSPAFTDPQSFEYDLEGTIKSITLQHEDTDVVIIGNFSVNNFDFPAEFTTTGTWYDFFEGTSIDVTETEQDVFLGPGEFKIYTTKEFESPEQDLLTSKDENGQQLPEAFRLNQNYPNPFNPSTVISYQLAGNSEVSLKVYDMLGREVAELVNGRKTAGSYEVSFDASQLSSGMYIYRLKAGSKVFTQKMMLIK
ncbi:alpha-amylase family glycosyl hydrolase [Gracilimonas mengyeensis]|uniref:Por secretion system C-terminal sorting domain-containing protein n=1 Tax=Gracilimonas mengyeensis TaxID=1302730 RepID=A0A521DVU6_9BACT|nr:alpha-amylase family glycosyl hydrolase [Gracilimonas mengyeensis]SMO75833.1 Por secretion system C-terminal sorting domain-containing protein [Gracilimonas mengyeensis]